MQDLSDLKRGDIISYGVPPYQDFRSVFCISDINDKKSIISKLVPIYEKTYKPFNECGALFVDGWSYISFDMAEKEFSKVNKNKYTKLMCAMGREMKKTKVVIGTFWSKEGGIYIMAFQ